MTSSKAPIAVSGIGSAKALSVGMAHACALLASGEVKCWGGNESGELGDGTTKSRLTPVTATTGAIAVAVSQNSSCALLATGQVQCWGSNAYGGLGDGTTTTRITPTMVKGF